MSKKNPAAIMLLMLMIVAIPAFGQFATTTMNPATQTVDQGSTFSVDIDWSIAFNSDPTVGIQAWIGYDPSLLQAVSVTGSGAPFSTEEINTIDNTTGAIVYRATGTAVNSGDYTVATVTFEAVGSGTATIGFSNVHQLFQNYGPYGVNGQASGASVDVIACTPSEQTFTIYGANGTPGDQDPYIQALPEGATEWSQAYLIGAHPWGQVPGTNSWLNFDPDNTVGTNTSTPYRIRFIVPDDFTSPSMVFQVKADNLGIIWVNDTYIDSVVGEGNPNVPDAVIEEALHTGLNEIRITMVDWGSIVGLNYRIDVTMTSCEDISDAVLTPEDAALLNNAPVADAGEDQDVARRMVTLDASGSSDQDGNLLTYSWSENGSEIATGVNPTVELEHGTHTLLLTVSDGELTDTDEVVVNVTIPAINVTMFPLRGTEVVESSPGNFVYALMVGNNTTEAVRVRVALGARNLETGQAYGPLAGSPVDVHLDPDEVLSRRLVQRVPARIPAGEYEFYCIAGNAENTRLDSAGFIVTKVVPDLAGAGDGMNWSAHYEDLGASVMTGDVWTADGVTRADGTELFASTLSVEDEIMPQSHALEQNHPNPFNPSTAIRFALPVAGEVSLKVYDINGVEVAQLANGHFEAGQHSLSFAPENMSSGTYLYVLETGSFREVRRMVFLK